MNKLFVLTILSVLLSTCGKSIVSPTGLTGRWELRNISGGFGGMKNAYTPGNGNVLQLNADSTFKQSGGFQIESSGTYRIIKNQIDFAKRKYDGIYYNGNSRGSFIFLKADSLTIGDPFPDGITSIYIRQKKLTL